MEDNTPIVTVPLTPVQSSNISGVGHDEESGALIVQFSNGTAYRYSGVAPETVNDFLAAESKGRYFAANIRGLGGERVVVAGQDGDE